MSEKERSSVDASRDTAQPVLPTVNPQAEKSEPQKASLHPSVYIAYVRLGPPEKAKGTEIENS